MESVAQDIIWTTPADNNKGSFIINNSTYIFIYYNLLPSYIVTVKQDEKNWSPCKKNLFLKIQNDFLCSKMYFKMY